MTFKGLGKTIQSIAFLAHLAEASHHRNNIKLNIDIFSQYKNIWGPFLVIAPVSTLHNWQREITKFCPALKVLPYWGTQKQRQVNIDLI
jgi:DNA helicase INO80